MRKNVSAKAGGKKMTKGCVSFENTTTQVKSNETPTGNKERNTYVRRHITSSLISLMKKYPFDDITITQICDKAEVGRASFYRNFGSKRRVLEEHLTDLIMEWGTEFEEHGDPMYFRESLLCHYYKHRDFYLLLYRHGFSGMIYETIRWACKLGEAEKNIERYGKSMFAGMLFGWLDEWMRCGMAESPEEIIRLADEREKRNP